MVVTLIRVNQMDPVTVIAIAGFAMRFFGGGGSSADQTIIENQLRILQGLVEISNQLVALSVQLSNIEEEIDQLPSSIEVFETVNECRDALVDIGDVYVVLESKITNNTPIDFKDTLNQIKEKFNICLDRLRYLDVLLDSDDHDNNLLYVSAVLDSTLVTSASHLLFPNDLYQHLKLRGAKLINPDLDPRIQIEEVQQRLFKRLLNIYERGEAIIVAQQAAVLTKLQSFFVGDLKQTAPPSVLAAWNAAIERFVVSIDKTQSEPLGRMTHEGILKTIRRFNLSEISGPSGRFVLFDIFIRRIEFNSNGYTIDLALEHLQSGGGPKHTDEQALASNGYDVVAPQFLVYDTNDATKMPDKLPLYAQKLQEVQDDLNGSKPGAFYSTTLQIRSLCSAFFYKGALLFTMKTRRGELKAILE